MDLQQIAALAVVAVAAVLLLRRYASGRRKPKFKECADCVAASAHAPTTSAPDAVAPAGPPQFQAAPPAQPGRPGIARIDE